MGSAWESGRYPPSGASGLWYFLNHACCARRANVSMRVGIVDGREVVYWVTTRHVEAGEELMFEYGEADPSWEVCEFCQFERGYGR